MKASTNWFTRLLKKPNQCLHVRSLIYRSNRSLNYRAHAHFRVTVQQFQPQRDFPPLALTFFHRAFAAADNLARTAALIFRFILRLFGDGSAVSGFGAPRIRSSWVWSPSILSRTRTAPLNCFAVRFSSGLVSIYNRLRHIANGVKQSGGRFVMMTVSARQCPTSARMLSTASEPIERQTY